MKLYNTLTRSLEEFKPISGGKVGVYSCGPTVYWNQHIGNMYAFAQWDILVRTLRFLGYEVRWVMNITDVGHMTSDADEGEDKMEKGAKREGISVWDIANKYIAQFLESIDLLNIQRPDVLPRATEHIQEQIDLIKKMEANGFTYKTKTGLVYDTSKFPDYARFGNLSMKEMKSGSRVEIDPEKRQPWDFLLWVTNQSDHAMLWDSPWGKGFPGWHIECTAMSTKYLGDTFDIHTGGKEHVSVHHTNEIAQGFGAFGHQTANYWLHNEWLQLKGGKLSKSDGETILVTDIVKKGYHPLALRYLYLTSNYRQGVNFDFDALNAAQNAYNKLTDLVGGWKRELNREVIAGDDPDRINEYKNRFIECLSDDLNTPQALSVVWQVAKSDLPAPEKLDLLLQFDQVLGLELDKTSMEKSEVMIPANIKELAEKREELRKLSNWEEADKIRDLIETMGYDLEDLPGGIRITTNGKIKMEKSK